MSLQLKQPSKYGVEEWKGNLLKGVELNLNITLHYIAINQVNTVNRLYITNQVHTIH